MIIRTAMQQDLQELLAIYNYEVEHTTATMDLTPQTLSQRQVWFDMHNVDHHPLISALIDDKVVGYASLSTYREKEAYQSTVELSIYVHHEYRRRGIASELMQAILDLARKDSTIHNVVSVITAGNDASRRLHEKFGFTFCGTVPHVGVKFGHYLGIDTYCLIV